MSGTQAALAALCTFPFSAATFTEFDRLSRRPSRSAPAEIEAEALPAEADFLGCSRRAEA
jgi:hypothetical protein